MALTQLNARSAFLARFPRLGLRVAQRAESGEREVTYDATQVSSDVSGCRQPGPGSVISSSRCLMKLQISSPFRHHLFLDGADTARSPATYPACV